MPLAQLLKTHSLAVCRYVQMSMTECVLIKTIKNISSVYQVSTIMLHLSRSDVRL